MLCDSIAVIVFTFTADTSVTTIRKLCIFVAHLPESTERHIIFI